MICFILAGSNTAVNIFCSAYKRSLKMIPLPYKLTTCAIVISQLFYLSMAGANSVSDEALLRTVGKQLYLRKNWAGAEPVYRKLIEICPKDYFAHEKLAKALLADGKAAEALNVAKQLVVLQSKEPESYYLIGKCLDQLGKYSEAVQNYKQAHKLCSANLNYVFSLANAYRKIGHACDAVDLLKITLREHQQLSFLWGLLFESAVDAGNINTAHEALTHFCQVVKQEKMTDKQKQELIAAGWHMIGLDCWRAPSYVDQLLLCISLDNPWVAYDLVETAKKKFLDAPEVFVTFARVISENTNVITDNAKKEGTYSQKKLESWNSLKRHIQFIRKQAEGQKLDSK